MTDKITELEDLEDKVGHIIGYYKGMLTDEWMNDKGHLQQRFVDRTPLYARNYDQIFFILEWLQQHCVGFDLCWHKDDKGYTLWIWHKNEAENPFSPPPFINGETIPEVLARAVVAVHAGKL